MSEFEERLQILTLNTPSDTAQVSGGVFSVAVSEFEERLLVLTLNTPSDTAQVSEGVFSVRSRKKGRNPDTATLNTPSDTKYTEQPDFHRFLFAFFFLFMCYVAMVL